MFEKMKTPRPYLNSGCLSIDEFVKCLKLLLSGVYELYYEIQDVMLLTSPTARNDASARLCEVWNKPKQSLVGSSSSSQHYL
jgi:hypothetical protein